MKYKVTVVGGASLRELSIAPGESLEVPLAWQDAAGQPLNMDTAEVEFRLIDVSGATAYTIAALDDNLLLSVPTEDTALWPQGSYQAELWATDQAGHVGAASFPLRVED